MQFSRSALVKCSFFCSTKHFIVCFSSTSQTNSSRESLTGKGKVFVIHSHDFYVIHLSVFFNMHILTFSKNNITPKCFNSVSCEGYDALITQADHCSLCYQEQELCHSLDMYQRNEIGPIC